jgi:hypothetical protein
MKQSSVRFASDEFITWADDTFAEPLDAIEELGGSWELFEFDALPDAALLIIEHHNGFTPVNIRRDRHTTRADTGSLRGFGSRFDTDSGTRGETQRRAFMAGLRGLFGHTREERRVA